MVYCEISGNLLTTLLTRTFYQRKCSKDHRCYGSCRSTSVLESGGVNATLCSDCSYTVTEEADEGGDGSDGDGLGGGAEEGDAAVRDEAPEHRRHLRANQYYM